jgi:RNA polymerase sigma-70 factor (ECF subfamily)
MVAATAALAQEPIGVFGTTGQPPVSSGTLPLTGLGLVEGAAMPSAVGARTGEIDSAIVAAAVSGDDEAFIAVMRHYDRRLRIVAYHVLGDRQLMDDVLQDVTLRVYGALPRFRGDSSLGTWLCRITYRVCCDAIRRNDRLYPMAPSDLSELSGCEPDPADALVTHALLADAFASLPPEQRLAVLLVDREGYDYATTAQVLGIPAGTLASRLSTARAVLRRRIAAGTMCEEMS